MIDDSNNIKKHINLADHILTQTYPLVEDTKILINVIYNIHKAIFMTISMALEHERNFKKIPPYHKNQESMINSFTFIQKKLKNNYIPFIESINEIIKKHKESPIEFTRKDKFVICSEDYKIRTISVKEMKKYISMSKIFLNEIEERIIKND